MQANDLNLSKTLDLDADEGQVKWHSDRVPSEEEAMDVMRDKLITSLGADLARGLLTDWGYDLGKRDAAALGRSFSWENDAQLLLAGPRLLHSRQGRASMEPKRFTLNRARGLVDIEVIWHRSQEAAHYLERFGAAGYPVCWTLVGYYSGYSSTLLGRPVVAVEITCAGMGADHCTIRLRGRDTWESGVRLAPTSLEPGHAVRVMQGELERLRFESSMRLNRLEALREAVLDVASELSLDGSEAKIVSRGRVLLGARYAFLVMFAEPSQSQFGPAPGVHAHLYIPRSYVVVHDGLSQQEAVALDPFPMTTGLFAIVLRDGVTVRVRRTSDDPRSRGMPEHQSLSSSFLGVPVRVHGQLCGALYFTDRLDGGEFSLDDEKLAESFAAHAGVALEGARHIETIHADRTELAKLLEREQLVSSQLGQMRKDVERERELLKSLVDFPRSPDIDSALRGVLLHLAKGLQADVGSILLCPMGGKDGEAFPEQLEVRACMEQGQQIDIPVEQSLVTSSSGLSGRVMLTHDVLYVRDVVDDPDALEHYFHGRGVRSLLGAPLSIKGHLIGVVQVGSYAVRTFEESEISFLQVAADQATLSIAHARLHQEVTRSAHLLQAVLEAAPIGIAVTVPPDGRTELSNGVMRKLEAFGQRSGTPPGGDAPLRALRGEVVSRTEQTLCDHGTGQTIAVRTSAAPVLDENGQVQAAVTVVQELTAEKELERLREQFVSLVAHDLRNPLNAAMMHLELLRERLEMRPGADPKDGQLINETLKTADAIHRSMMRVSDLVSDLLDYSRLEAGQLTIYKNDVALRPLVRELLDELRPMLQGRQVEIDIDDNLPALRADRRRLAQVLTNLLSNAIKYTPHGVRLGLLARPADMHDFAGDPDSGPLVDPDPTDTPELLPHGVLLTVWDLGPGIPPEERQRLFDPFYRLSRDQESREGTGLGLYISRGLCEAHGGKMWIDDVPGASFSILWPAAD